MAQTIQLEAKGLYTHRNPLTTPPGAMEVCDNVVIDKENVVSNRRGFKTFGNELSGLGDDQNINSLFEYKDRLIIHYHQTLAYDSNGSGNWTSYSGTYDPPSGENKIRSVEANRNFYFTTSKGIKKLDKINATTAIKSGLPKALGASGATSGSSGFFANNEQVCYRVVWGIEDGNNNLILGAPSERVVITNNSGGARVVDLTFPVPSEIDSSNYFYQIYRSGLSGGVAIEPNDELQLVIEKYVTGSQISALSVSVTDETPDSLMGATLYTSPSQQGISQANDRAPLAKDLTTFKSHTLFMNTVGKYRFNLTNISVGSPNLMYYDVTGDPQASGTTITNISSTTGLAVGQLVTWTGQPGSPAKVTQIVSTTVTIDQTITTGSTGTSIRFHDRLSVAGMDFYAHSAVSTSTPYKFKVTSTTDLASDIDLTTRSLIDTINKASGNTAVYAYYLSGYDDLPGKILFEERDLGGAVFYLTSSKGASFSPSLSETGTDDPATNDVGLNRIYISKTSLPEAVPTLNYIDVGSADKAIQRGIALRDSVFIFKQDGLYRLTGESVANFSVTLFDNTVRLIGEETAVPFNNSVFCYSNQGIISVSDAGVTVMSRTIESDILKLSSDNYPNFASASWSLAYESDRKYFLFTVSGTTDAVATTAYVYNSFTNSWTKWSMTRNAGIVLSSDDKMYLGSGTPATKKYIFQERKSFDIFDFADEQFSVTINSATGTTLTLADATNVVVGYTIAQSAAKRSKVTAIDGSDVTVSSSKTWATVADGESGAATVYEPYTTRVKWAPIHAGNPGVLKQFSELSMFFQDAEFDSIDLLFSTNLSLTQVKSSITPVKGASWGSFKWGRTEWGGGAPDIQPIRTFVPLESQRAHWLDLRVEHDQALDQFSLSGFSVILDAMSSRFM
tara:strand:- start:1644 stop:4355 length:2712 start_codon:yes stop_codon:yes gene_type:complete